MAWNRLELKQQLDKAYDDLTALEQSLEVTEDALEGARLSNRIERQRQCIRQLHDTLDTPPEPLTALEVAQEAEESLELSEGWQVLQPPTRLDARQGEDSCGDVEFLVQGRSSARRVSLLCTAPGTQPQDDVRTDALQRLKTVRHEHAADEAWWITDRPVPAAVRRAIEHEEGLRCLRLEEIFLHLVPLHRYFEWLEQRYRELRIEDYFVHQGCTLRVGTAGASSAQTQHGSVTRFLEAWLASPTRNHLSVLGDFGTGKSWLCWYLAYHQLQAWRAAPTRERIPILIHLRDAQRSSSVEDLFELFCRTHGLDAPFRLFQARNRWGRFLVLLDGFDEMQQRVEPEVFERNFDRLAVLAVPRSKVVLTCRTGHFRSAGHEQEVMAREIDPHLHLRNRPHFEILYLKEFNPEQVAEALERRLGKDWEVDWQRMKDVYNLPDLVKRPVMLEMAAASLPALRDRDHVSATDLYDHYTRRWIEQVGAGRSLLTPEDRAAFSRALAWKLFQQGDQAEPKIHWNHLLGAVHRLGGNLARQDSDPVARDVQTQSYLVRDAHGNYSFAHRSIGEYFVARELQRYLQQGDHQPFVDQDFPDAVDFFLGDLELDVDRLWSWLQLPQARDTESFLAGNVLTLLALHDPRRLRGKDFSGLVVRRAKLDQADLQDCRFIGAALRSLDISNADLRRADFTDAHFSNLMLGVRSAAKGVAASADGRWIASGTGENQIRVFDATSLQRVHDLGSADDFQDSITCVALSRDGRWVASGGFDPTVRVWDLDAPEIPARNFNGHTSTVYDVALDPAGRYVASCGHDRRVLLWDLETREELGHLTGHEATVYSVEFHPRGDRLATASFDKTLIVWQLETIVDPETGRRSLIVHDRGYQQLQGHDGLVNSVRFSPDGRFLASASNDTTLRLWDLEQLDLGKALAVFEGHTDIAWCAAFSPDGNYLASCGTDRTVRVWDVRQRRQLVCLEGHQNTIWEVTFDATGERVISGSHDSTVRVWNWRDACCIQVLKLPEDANQKIRCDGMILPPQEGSGLSLLQYRFLLRKGAVNPRGNDDAN